MKTKTNLFLLLALFFITPAMHSQNTDLAGTSKNVNELFKEFSKEKGVVRIKLGRVPMGLVRLFVGVKGVKGVEIMDFSDTTPLVKERLNRAILSLKDADYEKLISVNDEGTRVSILAKMENDIIRELIVMTAGNEPALIRIKGRIRPSDIGNIMNNSKIIGK